MFFSDLLGPSLAAIQDACLLAMLRVAAGCQSIPDEALGVVRKLQETAGRYIKRVRYE